MVIEAGYIIKGNQSWLGNQCRGQVSLTKRLAQGIKAGESDCLGGIASVRAPRCTAVEHKV